jgi:hypothetical protein
MRYDPPIGTCVVELNSHDNLLGGRFRLDPGQAHRFRELVEIAPAALRRPHVGVTVWIPDAAGCWWRIRGDVLWTSDGQVRDARGMVAFLREAVPEQLRDALDQHLYGRLYWDEPVERDSRRS